MPRECVKRNADVLLEIQDLRARGVHRTDICRRLRLSPSTYYRCLDEIGRRRDQGPPRDD